MRVWDLISILVAASLSAVPGAEAGARFSREELAAKAREVLSAEPEIQSFKRAYPGVIFKHPSFVDHTDYQSFRYHEVFVDKPSSREWEVFGGGVDVHAVPGSRRVSVGKRLLKWKGQPDLSGLIDPSSLGARLAQVLGLTAPVQENDYSLSRKLLISGVRALPVFWVSVKARALVASPSLRLGGARVVALDAKSGETIFNFSLRHHSDAAVPPIQVRDGTAHRLKSKKSTDISDDELKAFSEKYKEYCQVISTHKDSQGEPLLINPDKCELVVSEQKDVGHADDSSHRAQKNMETVLDYFSSRYGQFGFDNDPAKKTVVASIVHVGDHFDNAYWDEELSIMAYGDGSHGSGSAGGTRDYTLALDIAGHEFTHAIVSHTAAFAGPGEPGAMNEGFADIFGVLISRAENKFDNWSIGSRIFDNQDGASDEVALRSLSRPSRFTTSTTQKGKSVDLPFPEKYSQRLVSEGECSDDNDQCEVHANSTIWSHSAYLVDSGLQALGYKSMEADKMVGQLFFLTLTHRLHENSTMKEAAHEVMEACKDLFGEKECGAVASAFQQTELN